MEIIEAAGHTTGYAVPQLCRFAAVRQSADQSRLLLVPRQREIVIRLQGNLEYVTELDLPVPPPREFTTIFVFVVIERAK